MPRGIQICHLPPSTITVTIDDHVTISSLNLFTNVVLLFKDHSTLTKTDTLLLNGGTLRSDLSSSSSSTSLVVDADSIFPQTHFDDHVRVADFGTSKNLAATTLVTRPNAMSPKYAAPEQFDSRAVSSCQIPLIKSLPTPNSLSPSTLSYDKEIWTAV
ncbi:hypothetical protein GEMRC1_005399 [Eukaryota sp. GEM-RC1]